MGLIESNLKICGCRPRINGTRIRVIDILGMLSNKLSFSEITAEIPQLIKEDFKMAIV